MLVLILFLGEEGLKVCIGNTASSDADVDGSWAAF